SCQCAVHTTTSLCLPQWSTCYLMSLQKWDAPITNALDTVTKKDIIGWFTHCCYYIAPNWEPL
ncbi:MAG: hypothetical protein V7K25_30930, partial [Nostoc sp.]|uniref:hypothetical protein n=1 Tax=Nostoc sp. TaxID=1180 RepID=UPI002FFA1112